MTVPVTSLLTPTPPPGSNPLLYAGGQGVLTAAPSLSGIARLHAAAGGNSRKAVSMFRAARPLPEDAQKLLDRSLIRIGRERLVLVNDMLNAGLTFDLPNWLAVPTIQYDKINEGGTARRTMVPKARGERSILDLTPATIPVFCTWADFSFDIRTLLAAERAGYSIDTVHAEMATRNVNVKIEDQALNGAGFNVNGFSAPGFLTNPVNTETFVDNEAWTAANHSGEDIHADIMEMIEALQAVKKYGPYFLYVPLAYWNKLQFDYKSATSGTILERVTAGGLLTIRPNEQLPADTVLLMEMNSSTADVIVGQQPTLISWEDGPGFETFFIVLGCIVVRVKSDYNGAQGWVVGTPS